MNVENGGRSNYESLTVSVNKRMSKGLQFQFSYNHAKNLSNAGGYNPISFVGKAAVKPRDYYNPDLDYGHVPSRATIASLRTSCMKRPATPAMRL